MDNYYEVVHQMEAYGIAFRGTDLPLKVCSRKKTCGKGGKFWYKLHEFRPPHARSSFIVGEFGSYRAGDRVKVEWDRAGLTEELREFYRQQREAAEAKARVEREGEARLAALSAVELWRTASREGQSPYLERKGLKGEACRYLPDGTLVVPLIRYDLPRAQALQGVQRILPNGKKFFTAGFSKPACSVRLGAVTEGTTLLMVCEGYATGLSIRQALKCELPVFVALDAGNLVHVVHMLRELYPHLRILICADDDWRTRDQRTGELSNPGRSTAKFVCKHVDGCSMVWPVFAADLRHEKDTDYNDLHLRQGLDEVANQLRAVIHAMERLHG